MSDSQKYIVGIVQQETTVFFGRGSLVSARWAILVPCSRHESSRSVENRVICRSCYRETAPGGVFCPHCGARIAEGGSASAPVLSVPAGPGGGVWSNPWEERAGRGPVAAFAETLQQSLFHPAAFFRGTAPDRGAGAALLYAVLVGTLSIVVALLWQRALGETVPREFGGRFLSFFENRTALAGVSVFLPIGVAIGNLVWAAVLHVSLAVLGGARGTYATTLKAVCYSSSATAFNVFPICGTAIGGVWQMVVQVIGLRELHRTSTTRAFWAWFLPFVVAVCLAGVLVVAMLFGLLQFWQEFGAGTFAP